MPTNCSFLSDLGRQAAGTTHASHQWTYADGLGIKEAEETDYIGRREYESECVCMCVGGGVVIQCHIAIVNKVGLPAKDE